MKRLLYTLFIIGIFLFQPLEIILKAATPQFGTIGIEAAGTTGTVGIPYPSSIAAGDLLVACVNIKYTGTATVNTPASPWVLPTNGFWVGSGGGAAAADAGPTRGYLYVKEAVGDETGTLDITVNSGNSVIAYMARYTKTVGTTWSYAAAGGEDTTAVTTTWTWGSSNLTGVEANDLLVTCQGGNTDLLTYSTHSATMTGITFGSYNERIDEVTTQGDDTNLFIVDVNVTAGPSSMNDFVWNSVSSASATNRPVGGGVVLRLREVAGANKTCPGSLLGLSGCKP